MSNFFTIIITNTNFLNVVITNYHTNDIWFILTPQDWFKLFIANLLFPIAVGVCAFITTYYISQVYIRKKQSRIGVAITKAFIEEVAIGITILEKIVTLTPETAKKTVLLYLPTKCWNGMQSVSDDLLERLICLSKNKILKGYPIDEIRIHLKNYFENICAGINRMIDMNLSNEGDWNKQIDYYFTKGKFIEASKKVLLMLEHAKGLLEDNQNLFWPK